MTVRDLTLREWEEHFESVERTCPWPGPRPLRPSDESLLIGRDEDLERFLTIVQSDDRLVFLSGPSGVGKSSLIQAGIVPTLRDAGFLVLAADEWGVSTHPHPLRFLEESLIVSTRKSAAELAIAKLDPEIPRDEEELTAIRDAAADAAVAGLEPDGRLLARIEQEHRGRAVLLLDQFEELIRYSPTMKQSIFELLLRINEHTKINVVLSFRSEFLHEFDAIEKAANPHTLKYLKLEPMAPEHAAAVVSSGNSEGRLAITPAAASWITRRWLREQARTDTVGITDPFGRVGLLHLQAMLYTLYFAANGRVIDAELINALKREGRLVDSRGRPAWAGAGSSDPRGREEAVVIGDADDESDEIEDPDEDVRTYFPGAIVGAIGLKLRHCQDAGESLDAYLLEGATSMLTRAVAHLSSAGYKLIREISDLARNTMGSDLAALEEGMAEAHDPIRAEQLSALSIALTSLADTASLVEGEVDLLTADVTTIASLADALAPAPESASWVGRVTADDVASLLPWMVDELEVTSGATAGLPPARVLIEEMRRFHFALAWLRASSLVRLTNPGGRREDGSGAMVSLIHDGFGRPLREWSAHVGASTSGPLFALTAPRDATFLWKSKADADAVRPADIGGRDVLQVIPNLRWRGGWVRADFRDVIFVNCDFQGTRFDRCRFEGVTFVNCFLDGAIFSECRIRGPLQPLDQGLPWSKEQPTFVIEADEALVRSFRPYGREGGSTRFFSPLPGMPAVPHRDEVPVLEGRSHPFSRGGLTVYGGRISGFGMRGCDIASDSAVGLRHTTGSDLELVDLTGAGRYDIFGCALRHVTFSPQPDAAVPPAIHVDAKYSLLTQLWASKGVTGEMRVYDCTLVQAWNGGSLDIKVEKSMLFLPAAASGVDPRTVADDDPATPIDAQTLDLSEAPEALRLNKLAEFNEQAMRADYQQNPAQAEWRRTHPRAEDRSIVRD